MSDRVKHHCDRCEAVTTMTGARMAGDGGTVYDAYKCDACGTLHDRGLIDSAGVANAHDHDGLSEKKLAPTSPLKMVDGGGCCRFIMRFVWVGSHHASVVVDRVCAWNQDSLLEPAETEPYLEAFIKWDGCSHVRLGGLCEDDRRDGYLHLCGVGDWRQHCLLMEWVYKEASKLIMAMEDSEVWK